MNWLLMLLIAACVVFATYGFLLGDTCLNRCDSRDGFACQCNSQCVKYGDCCFDYQSVCVNSTNSCQGRCNSHTNSAHSCQCNTHCTRYHDCCGDYTDLCVGSTTSSSSCKTLSEVGQALWDNDVNRLRQSDITINHQTQISDGTSTDKSPNKLFTKVDASKLTGPTFVAFLHLLDNYNPVESITEHSSSHETHEVNAFLDAVLGTKVMGVLLDFLKCQSLVTTKTGLKTTLRKLWFDFYSRSSHNAFHSTSGFEHVFVGEYKNSSTVNGFHSWLSFYTKEKAGVANYFGYVSTRTNPDILGAAFTWNGHLKTKGTFLVGVSPEFDLAIYTLCYLLHKDDTCTLTIGQHSVSIKTYDYYGHIATAYIM